MQLEDLRGEVSEHQHGEERAQAELCSAISGLEGVLGMVEEHREVVERRLEALQRVVEQQASALCGWCYDSFHWLC